MDGAKAGPAGTGPILDGEAGRSQADGTERLLTLGSAFAGGLLAALVFARAPDTLLLAVAAAFAGLGLCEAALLVRRVVLGNAAVPAAPAGTGDAEMLAFDTATDGLAVVEDGARVLRANAAYHHLLPDATGLPPEQALSLRPGGRAAVGRLLDALAEGRPGTAELPPEPGVGAGALALDVVPLARSRQVLWRLRRLPETIAPPAAIAPEETTAPLIATGPSANPASVAAAGDAATPLAGGIAPQAAEEIPAGLVTIAQDRIVAANETFCRLVGLAPADLAAPRPLADLVRPAHLARLKVALAMARGPQTLTLDLLDPAGQSVPVLLRLVVETPGEAAAVVLPAPAAPAATGGVEGGLFFQRAPLALARVDPAGVIHSANGAFDLLFARTPSEDGRILSALVAERDRADLDAALARAAEPGQAQAPGLVFCDVALPGPGGRSARLYAARLGAGGPGGDIALCAVDTTAQKALEAQFTQSQKMEAVGHLAGGVAHDFNNLLTAIIGFCDLLIARHRPSDPSFPDIMQIKQNANRAADLVGQLLAFSRRQTLRPNVTQLTDVISDVSAMLRRLIGERITLDVRHGRGLWPVKVDANKFEQVIVNLAVNARDAMPDGGTLTVRTANVPASACAGYGGGLPEADHVLIEVEDTGTGIPPEVVDKIFEPFFTTKEVGKGTGLGLSTVYGIVQQTGGTLQVASEPGRGSTFRVFLPRHVGESATAVAAPAVAEEKSHDLTGHGRVLLVEDEDAVRAFAARALSARGYEVILAASGAEALTQMERVGGSVDLVVSDVVMPEMDGPSLLRVLRAREPGLKFIFMSGYAEEAFARNLPQSESFSFLPKPFSLKDLVGAVNAALKG